MHAPLDSVEAQLRVRAHRAGARRVSLTFRPGEGLLLTGLDGRVEEIEPNFDLDV